MVEEKIAGVLSLINSQLQKNFKSSVGRLFDVISCLLGLCDFNSFQGEGAVLLESMGQKFLDNLSEIPHNLIKEKSFSYYKNSSLTFNINPIIIGVVEDLLSGIDTHEVAFKFHSSLGDVITSIVIEYLNKLDINRVVLGGGCFQNKILTEIIIGNLENKGVEVFYPRLFPCNDGGLAVGQLAAVAFLRSKN